MPCLAKERPEAKAGLEFAGAAGILPANRQLPPIRDEGDYATAAAVARLPRGLQLRNLLRPSHDPPNYRPRPLHDRELRKG